MKVDEVSTTGNRHDRKMWTRLGFAVDVRTRLPRAKTRPIADIRLFRSV